MIKPYDLPFKSYLGTRTPLVLVPISPLQP
jgi:hypothetical protein